MAKTFRKVSGVWKPVKKIFIKIAGSWLETKKVYKKITGTWKVIHQNEVNYTFTGNVTATAATGILLSNYVDPTDGDIFNITVNSGVTLSGMTGATGAAGAGGNLDTNRANCVGTYYGAGGNGGTGGTGGATFDLTGFSGKTVNFINNGVIKTGKGGTGGTGGGYVIPRYPCLNGGRNYTASGCGGAGGAAGGSFTNNTGVTINIIGTTFVSGGTGATGGRNTGSNGGYTWSMSCDCDTNSE